VAGDPGAIRQILCNLTGNAVKFTGEGEVSVRARAVDEKQIEISIHDTGIGISAEKQGRIFEPFRQADNKTTRRFGGTGLGLAICKKLTAAMDGALTVQSEEGVGSVFRITVPLQLRLATRVPSAREAQAGKNRAPALAAIVEHRQGIANEVQVWLNHHGVKTKRFESLAELIQNPLAEAPDRILVISGRAYEREADRKSLAQKLGFNRVIVLADGHQRTRLAADAAESTHLLSRNVRHNLLAEVLEPAEAAQRPQSAAANDTAQMFAGRRVLVAEDNLVNQVVTRRTIERFGCTVSIVSNGQLAVDAVAAEPEGIDLILMDVQMPVMDGLQAARAIREMQEKEGGARMPIVALTANALPEDRAMCLEAGMDDYLSKPVQFKELERILRAWHPKGPSEQPAAAELSLPGVSCGEPEARPINRPSAQTAAALSPSPLAFKEASHLGQAAPAKPAAPVCPSDAGDDLS